MEKTETPQICSGPLRWWLMWVIFISIGATPWMLANGLFTQLPILIKVVPEGNKIASQLSLVIQIANVAPLLFMFYTRIRNPKNSTWVFCIVLSSFFASLCLAFFWNHTLHWGIERSIPLILLGFVVGGIGCLSSVVLWPFAAEFDIRLVSALSTGMGFSGLVPSMIALIQRPGQSDELFGTLSFFLIHSALLCVPLFLVIALFSSEMENWYKRTHEEEERTTLISDTLASNVQPETGLFGLLQTEPGQEKPPIILLMVIQTVVCFCNYFLPGVSTVITGRFQDSSRVLFLSNILSNVIGTFGRYATVFISPRGLLSSTASIVLLSSVQVLTFLFIMILSSTVEQSPLGWLEIFLFCLQSTLFGLINTIIYRRAAIFKAVHASQSFSRYLGLAEQVGSGLGALIGFFLVEFEIIH